MKGRYAACLLLLTAIWASHGALAAPQAFLNAYAGTISIGSVSDQTYNVINAVMAPENFNVHTLLLNGAESGQPLSVAVSMCDDSLSGCTLQFSESFDYTSSNEYYLFAPHSATLGIVPLTTGVYKITITMVPNDSSPDVEETYYIKFVPSAVELCEVVMDPESYGDVAWGSACTGVGSSCLPTAAGINNACSCMNACSSHGYCMEDSGTCYCSDGYDSNTGCSSCLSTYYGYPDCYELQTCPGDGNCFGHGSCNNQTGACVSCDTGYDITADCGSCIDGWYGFPSCYELQTCPGNGDCFGHGTCNNQTGACVSCDTGYDLSTDCGSCIDGWYGYPSCYELQTCPGGGNCNGHGTCNNQTGVCDSCNTGFDVAENCGACLPTHHDYPTCYELVACPGGGDCFGHGACNNQTGACVSCETGYDLASDCGACDAGWYGFPSCYELQTCPGGGNCNGHGSCNNQTGACGSCDTGYDLASDCGSCAAGYYGYPSCYELISCGDDTCSGHGLCNNATGICQCDAGFDSSDDCGACLPTHHDYPNCYELVACPGGGDCFGHGSCNNQTGVCVSCDSGYDLDADCGSCIDGWYGFPNCYEVQTCPGGNCYGHGTCNNQTGVCDSCFEGYDVSESCGACIPSYYGYPVCYELLACPGNGDCFGHGACNNQTGTCASCETGFDISANCGACLPTHHDYPTCYELLSCPGGGNCFGYGVCNNQTGACVSCDTGYDLTADCGACEAGYYGYPSCYELIACADDTCSGHGLCNNATGICQCNAGFDSSVDCGACLPSHHDYPNCYELLSCPGGGDCFGHGSCNNQTGACVSCDTGYDLTADCGACVDGWYGYPSCYELQSCPGGGNCFGFGSCNNQTGACVSCDTGYDLTADCGACATGYYGYPSCYELISCGDDTCSGHGLCNNATGICQCDTGFDTSADCGACLPTHHDYPNCYEVLSCPGNGDCFGHGTCNNQTAVCVSCDTGYDLSTDCGSCIDGWYGYPSCYELQTCPGNGDCFGHGTCNNQTGVCDSCNTGFDVSENCGACLPTHHDYPNCYELLACPGNGTCFGHGACNNQTGACISCETGYDLAADCGACEAGWYGFPSCYELQSCPGNGDCFGHGFCNNQTGVCDSCNAGYNLTADCGSCIDGWYGYPSCYELISCGDDTCSGHGLCNNATGICQCDTGFDTSADCGACLPTHHDYPNCYEVLSCPGNGTCFGHGACNNQTGACVSCDTGYDLASDCGACAAGWYGFPSCYELQTCPGGGNCNGHGTCNNQTGVCDSCNAGFDLAVNCGACLPTHHDYPTCYSLETCPGGGNCFGHGTCNNQTGTCDSCDTGFDVAANCSACLPTHHDYPTCYELIACPGGGNCFGHGSCNNQTGACVSCDAGYDLAADCGSCEAGWYGFPTCYELQTCPGNGDCFGHGSCNNQTGACASCNAGYDLAADCGACEAGWYGYPSCYELQSCPGGGNCNGHGTCNNQTGVCTSCDTGFNLTADCGSCVAGWDGYPSCYPLVPCSDDTCSGHGLCNNATGICQCETGFDASSNCGACLPSHHDYPACYEVLTCPGGGNCNGHGSCNNQTATCSCDLGYSLSDDCGACEPGWYGYPSCYLLQACPGDGSCNGHGSCNNATGICGCDQGYNPASSCGSCVSGYSGYPSCVPLVPCPGGGNCNGHGTCDGFTGQCTCDAGYNLADDCGACLPTHHGYPNCYPLLSCPGDGSCSGHGVCNNATGTCECSSSLINGTQCETCATGLVGYPNCQEPIPCSASCSVGTVCDLTSGQCHCDLSTGVGGIFPDCYILTNCTSTCVEGHGTCNNRTGSCSCLPQFAGPTCSACSANYFNYPNCYKKCPGDCSGNGVCNTSGECLCDDGFTGAACNLTSCPAVNPCQNGGTCEPSVGTYSCSCTDEFGGDDCTALSAMAEQRNAIVIGASVGGGCLLLLLLILAIVLYRRKRRSGDDDYDDDYKNDNFTMAELYGGLGMPGSSHMTLLHRPMDQNPGTTRGMLRSNSDELHFDNPLRDLQPQFDNPLRNMPASPGSNVSPRPADALPPPPKPLSPSNPLSSAFDPLPPPPIPNLGSTVHYDPPILAPPPFSRASSNDTAVAAVPAAAAAAATPVVMTATLRRTHLKSAVRDSRYPEQAPTPMPEERILKLETEAECLARTEDVIRQNPELMELIVATQHTDYVLARVCNEVTKRIMSNKMNDVVVVQNGRASGFVDVVALTNTIFEIAGGVLRETVAGFQEAAAGQALTQLVEVVVHEDRGPRPGMEDRTVAEPFANELIGDSKHRATLLGIMDGHSGAGVASYVATHLHINALRNKNFATDTPLALQEAFMLTNEKYFSFTNRRMNNSTGSTAVLAVITESVIHVAWAGDSEAALFDVDGTCHRLTLAHRPGEPEERARLESRGGDVDLVGGQYRLNGNFALSRAFGNQQYRDLVTAEPDIASMPRNGQEDFLVIGSDGLWNHMMPEAIGSFIRMRVDTRETIAKDLTEHVRSLGSTDNISIAIAFFPTLTASPM